jgi:hypothetical protein
VIEACICPGTYELGPLPGIRYTALCNPSGGSSDSMTLAIVHLVDDDATARVVLDAVREFMSLERRTSRGGRDSIDPSPGMHDDVANACAGRLRWRV